jgi:hypothetical protein
MLTRYLSLVYQVTKPPRDYTRLAAPRLEIVDGFGRLNFNCFYLKIFYSHIIHTPHMVTIGVLPGVYFYP